MNEEVGTARTVLPYGLREVARAFGATLRAIRKERQISQDRLGELCDFDRTYPSLMERGERHPTLYMLLRLARGLQVRPERLVTEPVARLSTRGQERNGGGQ